MVSPDSAKGLLFLSRVLGRYGTPISLLQLLLSRILFTKLLASLLPTYRSRESSNLMTTKYSVGGLWCGEKILEQLDNLWEQVYLQTKWELKPLLSYSVGVSSESLPSGNATPGATSSSSPNPDDATADATATLTTVTSNNTSTTPTVSNQQATTGNGPAVTQHATSPLSETQS